MSRAHGIDNPECREIFERLSEYVDGELDPKICESFDAHMGDCAPCQAFLESLRRTVRWLGRSPGGRIDAATKREILDAWARLKDRGGS